MGSGLAENGHAYTYKSASQILFWKTRACKWCLRGARSSSAHETSRKPSQTREKKNQPCLSWRGKRVEISNGNHVNHSGACDETWLSNAHTLTGGVVFYRPFSPAIFGSIELWRGSEFHATSREAMFFREGIF